jgi:hypothetical protein
MHTVMKFDLKRLVIDSQAAEPDCWIMLSTDATLPKNHPFLLSLSKQHPQYLQMRAEGSAISLEEAHSFFQDAIHGKCAISIFPMVTNHLSKTGPLSSAEGLAAERQVFGKQFESETPSKGLNGFLQKRSTRFPLEPKYHRELQKVLAWLESQL